MTSRVKLTWTWITAHNDELFAIAGGLIILLAVDSWSMTAGWLLTGVFMLAAGLVGAWRKGQQ